MKKRQIKLESLKVKSFITSIRGDFSMTIRGGSGDPIDGNDTAYTCGTAGPGSDTNPPGSGDGGTCTGTTVTKTDSSNPNGPCLPGQTEPRTIGC